MSSLPKLDLSDTATSISGPHKPGSDAALFEIIDHDARPAPVQCDPLLDKCELPAILRATTSSGYERRPLCAGHAHVVFADWMVGA